MTPLTQPLYIASSRTPVQRELEAGDMVGEYRIERKLGQGGMGAVYEAVHPIIDKRVALKILRREMCENRDVLDRFIQEARAVNRIGHRNIVDVFGFGKAPDGRAFLAMELLAGETLSAYLERNGALEIPDAVAILTEITHALEAAHRCGIVHRDLKPDNVFLVRDCDGKRVVKLLDFGIAKLLHSGRAAMDRTLPGTTLGTPEYIAPEQAQGHSIDCSADTYALGVMAFEMLTGRLPFTSNNIMNLIAAHIATRPPTPSSLAPLPGSADRLLLSMLDKKPANRPALERVRALLAEVAMHGEDMPVYSTPIPRTTGELMAVVHRRRWPWIAGALAAVVLMTGVVIWGTSAADVEQSAPSVDLPLSGRPAAAVVHEAAPKPRKRR